MRSGRHADRHRRRPGACSAHARNFAPAPRVNVRIALAAPEGATRYAGLHTAAGEALPSLTDQYLCYQAFLTGSGSATPEFTHVSITYGGTTPSSLRVYGFDDAGNLTSVTTTDGSGNWSFDYRGPL